MGSLYFWPWPLASRWVLAYGVLLYCVPYCIVVVGCLLNATTAISQNNGSGTDKTENRSAGNE